MATPEPPAVVLADCLARLADIVEAPFLEVAARLELRRDRRPRFYVNPRAAPEDRIVAMEDALIAIAAGPDAARLARRARHLRSVG